MGNIIEYALKFNKSFAEDAFNEVDGLILSQLCYLNLDGYEEKLSSGNYTIFDLNNDRSKTLLNIRVPKQNSKLLSSLANNPRFKDIKILKYINIRNAEKEQQFSATIYSWDTEGFVAFRGTDSTIVGWKEDFNAMFMDIVPSQHEGVKFLEENADILPQTFYIGGHSKGGNLAVYAAVNVKKEIQDRIAIVFDNDGPGVHKSVLDSEQYLNVRNKIFYLLPAQSVFGLILFNEDNYLVVKSDGVWIQQHDPFNWKILNNCFVYLDNINRYSSVNRETLNRWLYETEPEKRAILVDTIYKLITITNAEKVGDVPVGIIKNYDSVVKAIKSFNKEDLTKISEVLAEYKQIKKEIEDANPTENEHRANTDIQKFIKKVSTPIKTFIEKLPIEEYIEIFNKNVLVQKTKGVATKVTKAVTDTKNYVVNKTNNRTQQISESVAKNVDNAKKYNDEILDVIDVEPVIEYTEEEKKVKQAKANTKKFKEKYFDYYDDIKHYTKGEEDW